MCDLHTHSETILTQARAYTYDPTRTLTLRQAWVADMNRRFRDLIRVITETVATNNAFGLSSDPQVQSEPTVFELTAAGPDSFAFPRTADKMEAFMKWLKTQESKGILELVELPRIGAAIEQPWTNIYIYDSYKRGVMRARSELIKAGYPVPSITASGGIEAVLSSPFHIDRLGILYTRAFQELEGITAAMDTQISNILAQGLADGDNPNVLARKIVSTINGKGADKLGIRDSLGRYIPGQRRAQTLARTETIRAHHKANIQEYKNWQVGGVSILAEWITAGDNRVCPECEAGEAGSPYTLDQAEGMIPAHPNCRCIAIPIPNPKRK